MAGSNGSALQDAIDRVEALPDESQEILVEVVSKRLSERNREHLVSQVQEARAAYVRGEVHRGTAEDLVAELAE